METVSQPAPPENVFVTGATGYIGSALLRAANASGYKVYALARSETSAAQIHSLGATPVMGDLCNETGAWTSKALKADAIVHLAQPKTFGGRITNRRARRYRDQRLAMERALWGALDPRRVRRIVYVAGTSYYGECGSRLRDEKTTPSPRGWGPYMAPSIEALDEHIARGLPIVSAFPGWVYGPGSWFAEYVLEPLHARKPVIGLSGRSRLVSPVHVDDCARAILHLLLVGEIGQRYFVVDDEPATTERIARLAAKSLGAPSRGRRVPKLVLRLLAGRVIAESLATESCLSNARLRATGFQPAFSTCEEGVPDVVATWLRTVASKPQKTVAARQQHYRAEYRAVRGRFS